MTRYGGGEQLARGRAALLAMLALPGGSYIYQGEELGLEQVEVPHEHKQDPSYHRGADEGRDGCQVPMPWSGTEAPFGFGPGQGQPWLPQPASWKDLTVEAQEQAPDHAELLPHGAAGRRRLTAGVGDEVTWLTTAPGTLAFRRGDGFVCMVNCGSRAARVPAEAGELVLSSGPIGAAGTLPPDTAAWFLPA